jgi:hypothetical protein
VTPRRQLGLTVIACAAGAGVALLAASKGWEHTVHPRVAPLPPERVTRSGAALYPTLPAVALVALAGAGALLATRGTPRRLLGALILACGGCTAVTGVRALLAGHPMAWPLLCLVAGLLVAGAGVATVAHGHRWPGMGSRYERSPRTQPAQTRPDPPNGDHTQLWDALDRGEDSTRGE